MDRRGVASVSLPEGGRSKDASTTSLLQRRHDSDRDNRDYAGQLDDGSRCDDLEQETTQHHRGDLSPVQHRARRGEDSPPKAFGSRVGEERGEGDVHGTDGDSGQNHQGVDVGHVLAETNGAEQHADKGDAAEGRSHQVRRQLAETTRANRTEDAAHTEARSYEAISKSARVQRSSDEEDLGDIDRPQGEHEHRRGDRDRTQQGVAKDEARQRSVGVRPW